MRMLALLVGAALLLAAGPGQAADAVPRYEPGPCPFAGEAWAAAEDIDCGTLVVPENRRLDNGRTLRLPVAILRSTSADPEPDPYLFIQGGPGLPSLRRLEGTVQHPQTRRIRARRDYVLIDLRGTGDAADAFAGLGAEMLRVFAADLTPVEHKARMTELMLSHARQALETGYDLTAYTAVQTAADLADLMRLLPYEAWNLFGVSYGTRIALVAMRDAPERIRSVVLDSPLPIAGLDFGRHVPHIAHALERLCAACEADAACRAAYPDLERTFFEAIAHLEDLPLVVPVADRDLYPTGKFAVSSGELAYAFQRALGNTSLMPLFPLFVREAGAGNTVVMAAMIEALSGGLADGTFNQGTYNGMLCYDEASFSSQAVYDEVARPYPAALRGLGYGLDYCEEWPVPSATAEEIAPVVSSIPTLILHGEYDHQTPREFGDDLASRLENSYVRVFPGIGHYASIDDSCAQAMIIDFLDDPARAPDDACMDGRPNLSFVTDVYVTGGIYRFLTGALAPPRAAPLVAFGVVLLAQLSAVLIWPLAALRRRLRGVEGSRRPSPRACGLAGAAALLGLAFAAGLGWVIAHTVATNFMLLAFGAPGWARPVLALPIAVGLLAVVALGLVGREWRRPTWSRPWRWHYTAVTLANAGLAVLALYWGLV